MWLAQRRRNWRLVQLRTARPVGPHPFRDRKSECWDRPNRQTSSRQHGAPGVEPRLASGAIAGTTRRSDCSDIPRAGSGDTLPRAVATSHTCCFAVGDGWRRSRRAPGPMDCHPPVPREKAIHSVGDRPNPRAEANSDPPPKPVLDNDERWLGRWNNYGRSRSAAGQDRTANATLL